MKQLRNFLFGYDPVNIWYSSIQYVGKHKPLLGIWSSIKGAVHTVLLRVRTEWREAKPRMTEAEVQDMLRKLNGK